MEISYLEALQKVRDKIANDPVYITFDERTDKSHRHIFNVYIGSLNTLGVGPYLVHARNEKKTDAAHTILFIEESLRILYQDGKCNNFFSE